MQITIRRLTIDGRFEPDAAETLSAIRLDDTAIRWIDLGGVIAGELIDRLRELQLPAAAVAELIDPASRFDVVVQENLVCFNMTAPAAWWGQDPTHAVVHVFVLDRLLVTAHADPLPQMRAALSGLTRLDPRLPNATFGLVASLARLFYVADGNFFHRLRLEASRMETELDTNVQDFRLDRLVQIERAVSRLSATWLDNETAIRRLSGLAIRALTTMAIDVMAEQARVFRDGVAELDHRLDKIHRHYESVIQAMTEKRLRVLTVISAVFLPLSLIAGIYGMNFVDMPQILVKHGYAIILGLMIVLGAAGVLYFHRQGWFR